MTTSQASGTLTPVVGTETTFNGASFTVAGTYIIEVDTVNMALGDVIELRAYVEVLSGGTEHQAFMASYSNVQGDPIKISIPMVSLYSCHFTINQVSGTARAFPWNVITL